MNRIQALIDRAAEKCGGYAALGRHVDATRQRVYEWRNGLKPITPEALARVCLIGETTQEEARQLLAVAVATNPKNEDLQTLLEQVYGAAAPRPPARKRRERA